jgi:hypothetical protein
VNGWTEGQFGGFMIAVGDQDKYITVNANICFDNRNAGQDGIGLGQNAQYNSVGIVCTNNVVRFAGLFGIDAMANSIVTNNFIEYPTSTGIKVGTDNGGNQTTMIIANNIVAQAGNPTAKWPTITGCAGIGIAPNQAPALYQSIAVLGNVVYDGRTQTSSTTQYALLVDFETNYIYARCKIANNDFSGCPVGVFAQGLGAPTDGSWSFSSNLLPSNCPLVSGTNPPVWGNESVAVVNTSGTVIGNFVGGFEGLLLKVLFQDGNSTIQFATSANFKGNGGANYTPAAGTTKLFWWHANVWYMQ